MALATIRGEIVLSSTLETSSRPSGENAIGPHPFMVPASRRVAVFHNRINPSLPAVASLRRSGFSLPALAPGGVAEEGGHGGRRMGLRQMAG